MRPFRPRSFSPRGPSPMGWAEGWNAVGARNLQLKTGDCRQGMRPATAVPAGPGSSLATHYCADGQKSARHGIRTLYSLCFETAKRLDFHLFDTALPAHNVITYRMSVSCELNLCPRAQPSSEILDAPHLRRRDHRLSGTWHHVLSHQPLEECSIRRRSEERDHPHSDGEILQMILADDHHQAEHDGSPGTARPPGRRLARRRAARAPQPGCRLARLARHRPDCDRIADQQ